jgi:hypothetical protein
VVVADVWMVGVYLVTRFARVTVRYVRAVFLSCALSRVALLVLAPPLYLLTRPLTSALCLLAAMLRLLALALTPCSVPLVAVRVCGLPSRAHVVADAPELVSHTHSRSSDEPAGTIIEERASAAAIERVSRV